MQKARALGRGFCLAIVKLVFVSVCRQCDDWRWVDEDSSL